MLKHRLTKRLEEMADVIKHDSRTIALIALGSVAETERLDAYSDIDFFLVVGDAFKQIFIDDLSWLNKAHPLAYAFKNTKDGYKFFFSDGIYGEFAVFGLSEMTHVTMPKGRIVWQREDMTTDLSLSKGKIHALKQENVAFAYDEAMTNLYVGLCRAMRGERLSAQYFIERYAVSQILSILHHLEERHDVSEDLFGLERRIESRYPSFQGKLSKMLQGYDRLGTSAENIYQYIKSKTVVNPYLETQVLSLIQQVKDMESKTYQKQHGGHL